MNFASHSINMERLLQYTEKDFQPITLDQWLLEKAPELQPIARGWVQEIAQCGEDVMIIFHDGCPMGCVQNTPFTYVNAFTSHVNVGFFYGAFLNDKKKMLEGTGKRMRHVKVRPGAQPDEKAISDLINASYLDVKIRLREISKV